MLTKQLLKKENLFTKKHKEISSTSTFYTNLPLLISSYFEQSVTLLLNEELYVENVESLDSYLYICLIFLFQIIKMMIVVVVIYAICWLPLHVITIAGDINITFYNLPGMNIVWTVSHWLAMSNCMYNPFIYCWMNAKYRNGFIKVFSCFTCGILKSREEKIELQRMRRNHNNMTSVRSTFSHQYHRTSSTLDTEYSVIDGRYFP